MAGPMDYLHELQQYTLVTRLIESLVIIMAGALFLYLVRKIFDKISSTTGVDTRSINNMYKLIKTATIVVIMFLVLYTLTQASIIVLFILGTILIMLAASWEVIANVAAYYVILINRKMGKDDYIELRYDGSTISGKIREINPFFTTLESENDVYSIPNIVVLRSPARIPGPTSTAEIQIRIWGIEDPDMPKRFVRELETEMARISKPVVPSPKHLRISIILDEITSDSIMLRILIPLPSRKFNQARLNELLQDLAVSVRERGYPFSITLKPAKA